MGKGGGFNPVRAIGSAVTGAFMPKAAKLPKPPQIAKPTGPKQYSRSELNQIRGSLPKGLQAPSSLGVAAGMTPLQERTAIATRAVSGGGALDKAGLGYYRNLAYGMLGQKGQAPTDVERQMVTEGLGEKILGKGSTDDYLSAIERAYNRMK